MSSKNGRKQIVFDVTEDIHKTIKVHAAIRNITMNRWMQKAIYEKLQKDERYDWSQEDEIEKDKELIVGKQ